MRIGLNLLHALPEIGGGWNYIGELVAALVECDARNDYVAFVTRVSASLVPTSRKIERVVIGIRAATRLWRVAYENTMLQVLARQRKLDCMHWFAATHAWFNTVPSAVTFYDMQAFLNLANFSVAKRRYLQAMMRRTVREAQMLLPMSRSTAADLCRVLGADQERIMVIPPVVPSTFRGASREESAEFRRRHGLPEQYWLYVAHYYPHKNHRALFRAYRRLLDAEVPVWPLVLRGDPKGAEREIEAELSAPGLRDSVLQLPPLPRQELPLLYAAASALVFPSLYEGGGIPVAEALACGCPVAASKIPALVELAGDAALYFEPSDEASIAGAMQVMQEDHPGRQRLREGGLTRSTLFSPEAVTGKLTDAYRRAAAREPAVPRSGKAT